MAQRYEDICTMHAYLYLKGDRFYMDGKLLNAPGVINLLQMLRDWCILRLVRTMHFVLLI